VIVLIAVIVIHFGLTFRRALAARNAAPAPAAPEQVKPQGFRPDLGFLLALAAAALFAGGMYISFGYAFDSRLVPMLAAIPGTVAALALVGARLSGSAPAVEWPPRKEAAQLALFGAGLSAIPFAGFLPALGVYLSVMLWTCSSLRVLIVPYVAAIVAAVYSLSRAFNIPLP
jgi:hypothetical protein